VEYTIDSDLRHSYLNGRRGTVLVSDVFDGAVHVSEKFSNSTGVVEGTHFLEPALA